MTTTTPEHQKAPKSPWRNISRIRPWVQAAFLLVWLMPVRMLAKTVAALDGVRALPSCVFHCYGCQLASFACPIGLIANYAALHTFPFIVIGVLVLVGALVGSLVCGWVCPFGLLQDLLGKVPTPRFRIPFWMGHFRYAVLVGLVIVLPFVFGWAQIPYDKQIISICKVCPAGGIESGVPRMVGQAVTGQPIVWMSWYLMTIVVLFVLASLFTYRPWCTVLCPLGGLLAIFNHKSLLHLRFSSEKCTQCNLCRSRCPMGGHVERLVNHARCIRCMECGACGAIAPAIGSKKEPNGK